MMRWGKFFFMSVGPVEARPCPIPISNLRSASSSIINPSSPVPDSPPGPSPLSSFSTRVWSSAAFIVDEHLR
ncbi:hypothetical protein Scep_008704 [Stephania cephalantha]|uniref:Uncharacterized protein n=1 Tax=Stephania cephalantha TaxID=152367 RepID=A0AAP0JT81_9MAGN